MPKSSKRQSGSRKVRRERYNVFISYSTTDSFIAHVIKERVEALGAKAYLYEKDLEGDSVIIAEIIGAIDACHEAIVLESPSTRRKPEWVVFEIGAARGQHKRVTPILNNVSVQTVGPTMDLNAIELNDLEQFLRQLKVRIDRSKHRRR
jgi:hypothetical protein